MTNTTPFPPQKPQLRQEARGRRKRLSSEAREQGSAMAATFAEVWIRRRKPECVALYVPLGSEMDTGSLAERLDAAGLAMALPVVVEPGRPLAFRVWAPGDPLIPGYRDIPEPLPAAAPAIPDLLVVPLVAFDRRGHRIGSGAGFYDRTIARLTARREVPVLGYAFSTQEVDAVPNEPHDHPLDAIATEAGIIAARQ